MNNILSYKRFKDTLLHTFYGFFVNRQKEEEEKEEKEQSHRIEGSVWRT